MSSKSSLVKRNAPTYRKHLISKRNKKYGPAASSWFARRAIPRTLYNPNSRNSKNVLPPRYVTTLQYGFTGKLTASNSYEFAVVLNGLQAPGGSVAVSPAATFTGAGTGVIIPSAQALSTLMPNGFGLLALNWARYRVRSSTMKCTIIPAANVTSIVTVVPQNQYFTSTNGQQAQSRPYSKKRLVCGNGDASGCSIYSKMDVQSLFGITESQFQGDETFSSLTGGNPSKFAIWQVYVDQLSDLTSHVDHFCEIEVTYEVEFWDSYNISTTTY